MTTSTYSRINGHLFFVNKTASSASGYRNRLQSSKRTLKYLIESTKKQCLLNNLSTPLGYLSFSIYYLRLLTQLCIITNQSLSEKKIPEAALSEEAIYQLLNDFVWGSINFVEFFYWTYNKSTALGVKGIQLEICGLVFDSLIRLIKYQNKQQKIIDKMGLCSEEEYLDLLKQWQYQQKMLLLDIFQLSIIMIALSTLIMSLPFTVPFTPLLLVISLICGSIRMGFNVSNQKKQSYYDIQGHAWIKLSYEEKQVFNFIATNLLWPLALYLSLSLVTAGFSLILFTVILVNDSLKEKVDNIDECEQRSRECNAFNS